MKLSKELLQNTMGCLTIDKIVSTDNNRIDDNIYFNVKGIDILQCINIYELAYKCKEWADKQNFAIRSYIWFGKGKSIVVDLEDNIPNKEFGAISEVEAIFQAAEYILNQIDAKSVTNNLH